MTNTQFNIIGKVTNGRATVIVASEQRIVGYSRKVTRTNTNLYSVPATPVTPVQPTQVQPTQVQPVDRIDSPFIKLVNESRIRKQQERKEREERQLKRARSTRIKQALYNLLTFQ